MGAPTVRDLEQQETAQAREPQDPRQVSLIFLDTRVYFTGLNSVWHEAKPVSNLIIRIYKSAVILTKQFIVCQNTAGLVPTWNEIVKSKFHAEKCLF